jgi:Cytochrome P450
MEDDVYKDMHIPKGSLIFGNIWYVLLLMFYLYSFVFFKKIHSIILMTYLIPCVYRAMMRDETLYPDATAFRPERFMEPTTPEMERKMNPKHFVFGFGRR